MFNFVKADILVCGCIKTKNERKNFSMINGINEREAREKILKEVKEYGEQYHKNPEYKDGDRIPYASRVYDSDEMCNLVDSALEF